jgi:uncharacterized cupin superfamily protein
VTLNSDGEYAVRMVPMILPVTSGDLHAAPIEPGWIRAGSPLARNTLLSRSADGLAWTLVWDCSAGTFDWHYDIDETIYFLEGSVTICDGHSNPRTFTAGDVLFIPQGAVCHWHVEHYVKKVAFCRRTQPKLFALGFRAVSKLTRMIKGTPASSGLLSST